MKQAMLAADIVRQIGFHEELEAVRLGNPTQTLFLGGQIGRESLDAQFDVTGKFARHFRDGVAEVLLADSGLQLRPPGHDV